MSGATQCFAGVAALFALTAAGGAAAQDPQPGPATEREAGASPDFDALDDLFGEYDDEIADDVAPLVNDPFEPFNRTMFRFNNALDRVAFRPIALGYRAVVPKFGRNRVRDFIDNIKTPVWFLNETLQGDFRGAGAQLARFSLNSTVGILGFYDIAGRRMNIEKHDEDFGQTLSVYGFGQGPYLVLPLLGPSTTRDLAGTVGDIALDPLTWTQFSGETAFRFGNRAGDLVDGRERADDAFQVIQESLDPYVQLRTVYIQARNSRLEEAWRNDDQDLEPTLDDRYLD